MFLYQRQPSGFGHLWVHETIFLYEQFTTLETRCPVCSKGKQNGQNDTQTDWRIEWLTTSCDILNVSGSVLLTCSSGPRVDTKVARFNLSRTGTSRAHSVCTFFPEGRDADTFPYQCQKSRSLQSLPMRVCDILQCALTALDLTIIWLLKSVWKVVSGLNSGLRRTLTCIPFLQFNF